MLCYDKVTHLFYFEDLLYSKFLRKVRQLRDFQCACNHGSNVYSSIKYSSYDIITDYNSIIIFRAPR